MTATPFPVSPVLTGVALTYRNGKLIADDISPRRPVAAQTFKYGVHKLDERLTVPDTLVGRKSQPNEVEFTFTEVPAATEDHGLDDVVPNADIALAAAVPGVDPLAGAVEGLTDLMLLSREMRVAGMTFNAANYAAANKLALVGQDKWSDYVNSTPVDDHKSALDSCIMRPNVAVYGRGAWSKLSSHPQILAAVGKININGGIATKAEVADLFELDEILVGEGWVNSAKPGQPLNRVRVWANHAALIVRDKLADFSNKRATFSLTAQWGGRIAGSMNEPKIGLRGSTRVRVGESLRELVIASDLGFFLQDVI
jgi:hypothetical protein